MQTHVVLLNGPPGSGKDEAVIAILNTYAGINHLRFKDHLIDLACLIYLIPRAEWDERYEDRELKEAPWDKLNDMSQRKTIQFIAEVVLKPHLGKRYFGEASVKKLVPGWNVFSDTGFPAEVMSTLDKLKGSSYDKVFVIRIHREGFDFTSGIKDTRKYLTSEDFPEEERGRIVFKDIYSDGANLRVYHDDVTDMFGECIRHTLTDLHEDEVFINVWTNGKVQ